MFKRAGERKKDINIRAAEDVGPPGLHYCSRLSLCMTMMTDGVKAGRKKTT